MGTLASGLAVIISVIPEKYHKGPTGLAILYEIRTGRVNVCTTNGVNERVAWSKKKQDLRSTQGLQYQ